MYIRIIIFFTAIMLFKSCNGQKYYDLQLDCNYNRTTVVQDTIFAVVEFGQSLANATCADDISLVSSLQFNNVQIYNGAATNQSLEPMQFGVNTGESNVGSTRAGNFSVTTVHAALTDNIIVLKRTRGGTPMHRDHPVGRYWDSSDLSNSLYASFVRDYNNLKSIVEAQNPGSVFAIKSYNFMQGQTDANADSSQGIADDYEQLLTNLVEDVFALMGEAPFYINLLDNRLNATDYPYRGTIRAAQESVINNNTNVFGYASEDCDFCDQVHYEGASTLEKGLNFPNQ